MPGIADRRRQLALQLERFQREMEVLRAEEDHLDRTCVMWREFVGRYAPDLPTVQARRDRSADPTEGRFR